MSKDAFHGMRHYTESLLSVIITTWSVGMTALCSGDVGGVVIISRTLRTSSLKALSRSWAQL